jgi:hypothetical protein
MEVFFRILDWFGYISTVIVLSAVGWRFYQSYKGISPVLKGLGHGLAERKIAIFAQGDNLTGLKQVLHRSTLFRDTNIIEVPRLEDIGNAEYASVFVVNWPDWGHQIARILAKKTDKVPLIIYCPRTSDPIPKHIMEELDEHRNTAVTNFRGRLLNDIVTAMITTTYEK